MLTVSHLDLFYGASQALRNVSLSAARGAVTCVLGRNGVGKSSLLRAVVGQQTIAKGEILWEDEEISNLPPHARTRKGIASVPQGREIF
ncbi:MAG: ATP-binding cassette domain-containing protein, partial [Rhodospirillaceae bacterium]|nr:ATP-binding cassette domain-containing protein [Rhodospirillaceae bacterium]